MINDYAKRLKQAEHQAADLQKRCDELSSDLQSSNSENQRVLAELTRLKTSVNDQQSKIDSLTRDNNKLTGLTLHFMPNADATKLFFRVGVSGVNTTRN